MAPYCERTLGHRALEYIDRRLREGRTLARHVRQHLDLSVGRVSTWLPPEIADDAAYRFEEGGKLPLIEGGDQICLTKNAQSLTMTPVPNTDDMLIAVLQAHLQQDCARIAIFEDPYATPGDPFLTQLTIPFRCFEGEVYYCLGASEIEPGAVRKAFAFSGIGLLTCAPRGTISGPFVGADELKKLACNTRAVVVAAYDGEGFLLWRRVAPPGPTVWHGLQGEGRCRNTFQ